MSDLTDSTLTRNGKSIVLAHDHGLEHGPTAFSAVPDRLDPDSVFEIATHDAVTAFAVHKGLAKQYYPSYKDSVNLLAKCNGSSSLHSSEPYSPQTWSVDHAAEIGADAIGYTVYPGTNTEQQMFTDFSQIQEAAEYHDLPVAMWSYPRGQPIKEHRNPDTIAYATRIGLELGADFVKVKYPRSGEAMAQAVDAAGACNVLLSGGSKSDDLTFLSMVETAIDAGVSGLAVGRNVWQREDPEYILDALEKVVFAEQSAEAALS